MGESREDARAVLIHRLVERGMLLEDVLSNSKYIPSNSKQTADSEGRYPSHIVSYDLSKILPGIKYAEGSHKIQVHTVYDSSIPPEAALGTNDVAGFILYQRVVFENPEFRGSLFYDPHNNRGSNGVVIYGPFGVGGKFKRIPNASLKEGVTRMLLEFLKSQNKSTQVMPNE